MVKKILIILVILFAAGIGGFFTYAKLLSPTEVHDSARSGIIIKDEIWNGRIDVVGDILTAPWVKLTILPGTEVVVAANQDRHNLVTGLLGTTCDGVKNYDLQIGIKQEDNYNCGVHFHEPYRDEGHHISILVLGTLQAVGTETQRIIFRSDSPTPTIYDWNSISIRDGILSYANVENYRGIAVLPNSDVEISHNNLKDIGECGVCGSNDRARVLSNHISSAGHELIDMWDSFRIIRDNHLGPNPGHAGIIINGGSPEIVGNTIEGCNEGIVFNEPPDQPVVENNTFLNNTRDILHNYPTE